MGAGGWQARGTTKHHSSLAHFNPHNSSELSRAPTTLQRWGRLCLLLTAVLGVGGG